MGTLAPPVPEAATVLRYRLDNGLRVVLLPDAGPPAVGIAVGYDVGYRTEARSGFAHLFEHLMFQGSGRFPKLAHARHVQAAGGVFNGTTQRDHTCYFEVLPAEALELGLRLEADRMRGLTLTAENVANQVAVVGEEIRRNVLNRPYGGFPTFLLPPALFDRYANTHDGYGDVASLASATVDECAAFFDRYYAPGNAVLAIGGRFAPDAARELVLREFGDLPARPVPEPPDLTEPPPRAVRTAEHRDRLAPTPAVAIGLRCPPPGTPEYVAAVVVAALLGDGPTSRLHRRLVRERRLADQLGALPGLSGTAFDSRDPDALVVTAVCAGATPVAAVTEAVRHELGRLATAGPEADELRRTVRRLRAAWYREHDPVGARTRRAAALELLYGDPGLVSTGPDLLSTVDIEAAGRAAAALAGQPHAAVHVIPERTS